MDPYHAKDPSWEGSDDDEDQPASSTGGTKSTSKADKDKEKTRRAYKACANCRQRKARCDLGDINNPRDPPCSRCKREHKECVFQPSRRGGNLKQKKLLSNLPMDSSTTGEGGEASSSKHPLEGPQLSHRSKKPKNADGSGSSSSFPPHPTPFQFTDVDQHPSFPQHSQSPPQPLNNIPYQPHNSFDPSAHGLFPSPAGFVRSSSSQPPRHVEYDPQAFILPPLHQQPPPAFSHHPASNVSGASFFPPPLQQQKSSDHGVHFQLPSHLPAPPSLQPHPTHSHSQHQNPSSHHQNQKPSSHNSRDAPPQRPATLSPHAPQAPPYNSAVDFSDSNPSFPPCSSTLQQPTLPKSSHRRANTSSKNHDPESFVTGTLSNESDALSLLALTATEPKSRSTEANSDKAGDTPDTRVSEKSTRGGMSEAGGSVGGAGGAGAVKEEGEEEGQSLSESETSIEVIKPLEEFDLVRRGILTKDKLWDYVQRYFQRHHQIFPMVPTFRIPKSLAQLERFASEEKHLTTIIVLIASRYDQASPDLHDLIWPVVEEQITEVVVRGRDACVGFVEGMLLLSENLPRQSKQHDSIFVSATARAKEDESQSWCLVGHAVRIGYLLGLDQTTLSVDESPTTPQIDRERLAWSYCYLFDRHISLKMGKAFWSRGPGLCFAANNARKNFPSLAPAETDRNQPDFASVVQAMIELTQTMTAAHDILYPSTERTNTLSKDGSYYKYLDEFTTSIKGFQRTWSNVRFIIFPCEECVWATYHYLRLFIYSFAFEAHVRRAVAQGESPHCSTGGLFPRGTTQSPDAKFIFESIDAAKQLLEICTERLYPGGALPFVSSRFYLWFTFSAVFLLKAIYSGAVLQGDTKSIFALIKKVVHCLYHAAPDAQHVGRRNALLLRTVAEKLRSSFAPDEWVSHTGAPSPVIPDRTLSLLGSPQRPHFPSNGESSSNGAGVLHSSIPPSSANITSDHATISALPSNTPNANLNTASASYPHPHPLSNWPADDPFDLPFDGSGYSSAHGGGGGGGGGQGASFATGGWPEANEAFAGGVDQLTGDGGFSFGDLENDSALSFLDVGSDFWTRMIPNPEAQGGLPF